MQKLLLLIMFAIPAIGTAKSPSLFDQSIKKYQKSKMVSMNVEKTVVSEILAKETTYSGQIKLSSGKFRWENEKPEKTLLLFDGKNLFSVQYPSKEFNTGTQVATGIRTPASSCRCPRRSGCCSAWRRATTPCPPGSRCAWPAGRTFPSCRALRPCRSSR